MEPVLTILGSSAAIPAHDRGLSSQILQFENAGYLLDCGEGTQFALQRNQIKLSKICCIFISHLHGDHIFGLPGLLSTMSMQNSHQKLKLFGPPGLIGFLNTVFDYASTQISFDLEVNEFDPSIKKNIYSDEHFQVCSIPLDHRVPASGFLFRQKAKLNILPESIKQYSLNHNQINDLKKGKNIQLKDGTFLTSEDHTREKNKPLSFAYISDTRIDNSLSGILKEVDLLFHEATYLDALHIQAQKRFHSTVKQAAELAKVAEVKKLVIGHFSSRYKNLDPLLEEARSIFPASYLAIEGTRFTLGD